MISYRSADILQRLRENNEPLTIEFVFKSGGHNTVYRGPVLENDLPMEKWPETVWHMMRAVQDYIHSYYDVETVNGLSTIKNMVVSAVLSACEKIAQQQPEFISLETTTDHLNNTYTIWVTVKPR